MNILMVTNTFLPHVGGVARSVADTASQLEAFGHRVLTVCPTFEGVESTESVLRVPAIEHFRHTGFSFPLPIPSGIRSRLRDFQPDVVHSHHPFLLGDTALRVGAERDIPVVFTHHTQYDKYAHYMGSEQESIGSKFINELDIGYCNLCDAIIAPSQSVGDALVERGVQSHIQVIPTGIHLDWWSGGSTEWIRNDHGIPEEAFVVGHVGRLAHEKNLPFLADAVAEFLRDHRSAWFVVAGTGPCEADIRSACEREGVLERCLIFGVLDRIQLRDLYCSFDVFAFASQSETQGIVLAEAMASGVPVVALDGDGVRELVTDQVNGRLLKRQNRQLFVDALSWVAEMNETRRSAMQRELRASVEQYSLDHTTQTLLELYEWTSKVKRVGHPQEHQNWNSAVNRMEQEASIWSNFAHSIGAAVTDRWGREAMNTVL